MKQTSSRNLLSYLSANVYPPPHLSPEKATASIARDSQPRDPLCSKAGWIALGLKLYRPTGSSRFVDAEYYRQRFPPFLSVDQRLAVLTNGLDKVLKLVSVCH
jgi:hypothetical protein